MFGGRGGTRCRLLHEKCNIGDVSKVDVVSRSSLENFLENAGYLLDFLEAKRLWLDNGSSKAVVSGFEAQLFQILNLKLG